MPSNLEALTAELAAFQGEYEDHKAAAAALKPAINAKALEVVQAEQEAGDELAFAELRARDDVVSARVAAKTIAATMQDSERAARFEALADELAAG